MIECKRELFFIGSQCSQEFFDRRPVRWSITAMDKDDVPGPIEYHIAPELMRISMGPRW